MSSSSSGTGEKGSESGGDHYMELDLLIPEDTLVMDRLTMPEWWCLRRMA